MRAYEGKSCAMASIQNPGTSGILGLLVTALIMNTRVNNLFYIIGSVLVVLIGGPKRPGCGRIQATPLPCGRKLWDPDTIESWALRFHDHKRRKASDKVLTIGDIEEQLGSRRLSNSGGMVSLIQKDLTRWCGDLDELGMLIWMAAQLNRAAT